MKQVLHKTIYPVLIILLAYQAIAGDSFYVATNGNDDTGDGSAVNPWATITNALDNVPDGSLILVKPGIYNGRIRLRGVFDTGVTVRSETPYQALLRHDGTVLTCFDGIGITVEGFDIAHDGPGAAALVIQIQDLRGEPGGEDAVRNIVFRDNIIHDSYNNDLLKINNGAREVLVQGNLFYNQQGSDEHMDVNGAENVTICDNIFFNDFEGSGRPNNGETSSFVVMKNSAALGASGGHVVKRNIFLNWQGNSGTNFVLVGEDGHPFHEAVNILIENNLMIGNSNAVMRAAFGVKGGREITFRNNTIVGDLPSLAYAMRLNIEGQNPPNEDIRFYNNIWSDPTGTMGAEETGRPNDFSDTPPAETLSFTLQNNCYWNGGETIPTNQSELVNIDDDSNPVTGDPRLADQAGLLLPHPTNGVFPSGTMRIRAEFERLVVTYAEPMQGSVIIDAADPIQAAQEDILGAPRDSQPDIGAYEIQRCSPEGDLDQDEDVDLQDLTIALAQWAGPPATLPDMDGVGLATVLDLTALVNAFGTACP